MFASFSEIHNVEEIDVFFDSRSISEVFGDKHVRGENLVQQLNSLNTDSVFEIEKGVYSLENEVYLKSGVTIVGKEDTILEIKGHITIAQGSAINTFQNICFKWDPLIDKGESQLFQIQENSQIVFENCIVECVWFNTRIVDLEGEEEPEIITREGLPTLFMLGSSIQNSKPQLISNSSVSGFSSMFNIFIKNIEIVGCYLERFWKYAVMITPSHSLKFDNTRVMNMKVPGIFLKYYEGVVSENAVIIKNSVFIKNKSFGILAVGPIDQLFIPHTIEIISCEIGLSYAASIKLCNLNTSRLIVEDIFGEKGEDHEFAIEFRLCNNIIANNIRLHSMQTKGILVQGCSGVISNVSLNHLEGGIEIWNMGFPRTYDNDFRLELIDCKLIEMKTHGISLEGFLHCGIKLRSIYINNSSLGISIDEISPPPEIPGTPLNPIDITDIKGEDFKLALFGFRNVISKCKIRNITNLSQSASIIFWLRSEEFVDLIELSNEEQYLNKLRKFGSIPLFLKPKKEARIIKDRASEFNQFDACRLI